MCTSQRPTTIPEDLSDLFLNNENLNTAFGSQGLSNIANFSHPEKYAVIWILSLTTLLQVGLYFYGKKLDLKVNNRVHPILLPQQVQLKEVNGLSENMISNHQMQQQHLTKDEQSPIVVQEKDTFLQSKQHKQTERNDNQNNKLNMVKHMNADSKLPQISSETEQLKSLFIFNDKNEVTSKLNNKKNENCEIIHESPSTPFMISQSQNTQMPTIQQVSSLILQSGDVTLIPFKLKKGEDIQIQEENSLKSDIKNKANLNSDKHSIEIKEDKEQPNDQNKELSQEIIHSEREVNEIKTGVNNNNQQQFLQKHISIQMLIFHSFFGIFLTYDKVLSRSIRFQLFYISIVHSLAISIIFGQFKAFAQKVAVAIINTIVIKISTVVILWTYKKGRIGKITSLIVQLSVLVFYYYIILATSSGKEADESNQFILLFFLTIAINLLMISTLIAFAYRFISKKFIESQEHKFYSKLFLLLEIQSIINNINF